MSWLQTLVNYYNSTSAKKQMKSVFSYIIVYLHNLALIMSVNIWSLEGIPTSTKQNKTNVNNTNIISSDDDDVWNLLSDLLSSFHLYIHIYLVFYFLFVCNRKNPKTPLSTTKNKFQKCQIMIKKKKTIN